MPPVPSARRLISLWDDRDERYKLRKSTGGQRMPLTQNEVDSIKAYRLTEAQALPGRDRAVALVTLSEWKPPAVMA